MKSIQNIPLGFSLLFVSLICLQGCGGGQAARDVALQTSAKLTHYEKQINDKVTTEKAFYQNEVAEIRKYLAGEVDLGSRIGEPTIVQGVERSLFYGRIVNTAYKDARGLAESMINSKNANVMGQTMSFIRKGVEDDLALYREISGRQAHLRESFIKELVKIDQQKARLKKVKQGLTKLSDKEKDKPDFEMIKGYAEVIKTAIDGMDEENN